MKTIISIRKTPPRFVNCLTLLLLVNVSVSWAVIPEHVSMSSQVTPQNMVVAASRPGQGRRVPPKPSDKLDSTENEEQSLTHDNDNDNDDATRLPALPYRRPGHGVGQSHEGTQIPAKTAGHPESTAAPEDVQQPENQIRKPAPDTSTESATASERDRPEVTNPSGTESAGTEKKSAKPVEIVEDEPVKKRIRFKRPGHGGVH